MNCVCDKECVTIILSRYNCYTFSLILKMIKAVREFYGFTQQYLADYLKVTRSQLAMSETERRTLPHEADSKISELFMAIIPCKGKYIDEKLTKATDVHEENKKSNTSYKLRWNPFLIKKLTKELDQMKENNQKSLKIIESIDALKPIVSAFRKPYLEVLENEARDLHAITGVDSQLNLELKIKILEAEFEHLQKISKD